MTYVFVFCSVINAVLIEPISRDESSPGQENLPAAARPLQLNVHTSSSITRKSSVSDRQQLLKV